MPSGILLLFPLKIFILHIYSTMGLAGRLHVDRIIVMDRGCVAESGSYEELLAKGGLFAELHSIATVGMIREARMAEAGFA